MGTNISSREAIFSIIRDQWYNLNRLLEYLHGFYLNRYVKTSFPIWRGAVKFTFFSDTSNRTSNPSDSLPYWYALEREKEGHCGETDSPSNGHVQFPGTRHGIRAHLPGVEICNPEYIHRNSSASLFFNYQRMINNNDRFSQCTGLIDPYDVYPPWCSYTGQWLDSAVSDSIITSSRIRSYHPTLVYLSFWVDWDWRWHKRAFDDVECIRKN